MTVDGFHITVEKECTIEGYRRNVFAGIDSDDRLIIVNASHRVIIFTRVEDDVWDYEVYASVTSYLKADGRYPGFMTSRPCDLLREFCRIVFVDEGKHVPYDASGVIIKRYPLLDAVDRPTHCRSEPRTLPATGVPVSQMNVSIFQGFIGYIAHFMTVPELLILRYSVAMTDDVFDDAIRIAMRRDGVMMTHVTDHLTMVMRPSGCVRVINAGDRMVCVMGDGGIIVSTSSSSSIIRPSGSEILNAIRTMRIIHSKPKVVSITTRNGMYAHEHEQAIGLVDGVMYIPCEYDIIPVTLW